VKRSEKSVPLWVAELLPLLHQITKIDSSICFGFCVCFCSWVFGARSGREWCCLQELVDFFSKGEEEVHRRKEKDQFSGFWICLHCLFLCFLGSGFVSTVFFGFWWSMFSGFGVLVLFEGKTQVPCG